MVALIVGNEEAEREVAVVMERGDDGVDCSLDFFRGTCGRGGGGGRGRREVAVVMEREGTME